MSIDVRTNVIGNTTTFELAGRTLEELPLRSDDLAKRVLRFATSVGEIGIRFAGTERLHDGDIVFVDDRLVVAVRVVPEDVLILRPATIAAAVHIAHALGNRHLPIATDAECIVVRYDRLLEALASEHGVGYSREKRVISKPFRHVDAPHRHD